MARELVHENTFGNHLMYEGAIEHTLDTLPSDWGGIVNVNEGDCSWMDNYYEATVTMENGFIVNVELFFSDEEEDTDYPWVCKAYKMN